DRHKLQTNRARAESFANLSLGNFFAFEILVHQVVVDARDSFDQLLARSGGGFFEIFRNVSDFVFSAFTLVFPEQALHRDQIDDAFELVLEADRNLKRDWICAETSDDRLE